MYADDSRLRMIAWGIIGGLVVLALFVGLLVWAVHSMSENSLRWWAAIATFALLPMWGLGYLQGKSDSYALKNGIQTGVGAVMTAANATADLRVRTAQTLRGPKPTPTAGTAFNVYLPGQAQLGAPQGYAPLLPPTETEALELF
jgi:hypothetical protein